MRSRDGDEELVYAHVRNRELEVPTYCPFSSLSAKVSSNSILMEEVHGVSGA